LAAKPSEIKGDGGLGAAAEDSRTDRDSGSSSWRHFDPHHVSHAADQRGRTSSRCADHASPGHGRRRRRDRRRPLRRPPDCCEGNGGFKSAGRLIPANARTLPRPVDRSIRSDSSRFFIFCTSQCRCILPASRSRPKMCPASRPLAREQVHEGRRAIRLHDSARSEQERVSIRPVPAHLRSRDRLLVAPPSALAPAATAGRWMQRCKGDSPALGALGS